MRLVAGEKTDAFPIVQVVDTRDFKLCNDRLKAEVLFFLRLWVSDARDDISLFTAAAQGLKINFNGDATDAIRGFKGKPRGGLRRRGHYEKRQ